MNWYKGDIAQAVAESKAKNAIFVVFVEGKDENTQKLKKFIDEEPIRSKLESNNFVAIKIESESQTYMQFATIYQMVPVPSIFFIGKSGTPLEIGTGVIASVGELEQKIDKVLTASGKSAAAAVPASTSFIAAEQATAATTKDSKNDMPAKTEQQTDEIVCDGDVCYKKPKEPASTSENTQKVEKTLTNEESTSTTTATAMKTTTPTAEEADKRQEEKRLEETRKALEQKRRERVELEQKMEKERELQRRREGKDKQNAQTWQKEQELKELKDNIKRERLQEQAARERIRAQIAADRAERAQKFAADVDSSAAAANTNNASNPRPAQATDTARLQFRFANGENKMHTFNCHETLGAVRAYVKTELLPASGMRGDFILATTYPKREFTVENEAQTLVELELFPSAVILVIAKEISSGPGAIISRSGGLVNMFTTLFWAMLSPVFAIFGYIKNIGRGGGGNDGAENVGAQKRANEEKGMQHEAAKRRNLDRFTGAGAGAASGSKDAAASSSDAVGNDQKPYRRYGSTNVHRLADNRKDSDDENATWNGNSTQQQ